MSAVAPLARRIEVGELLPGEGPLSVAADIYLPAQIPAQPTALYCLPGGAMSRGYFDLQARRGLQLRRGAVRSRLHRRHARSAGHRRELATEGWPRAHARDPRARQCGRGGGNPCTAAQLRSGRAPARRGARHRRRALDGRHAHRRPAGPPRQLRGADAVRVRHQGAGGRTVRGGEALRRRSRGHAREPRAPGAPAQPRPLSPGAAHPAGQGPVRRRHCRPPRRRGPQPRARRTAADRGPVLHDPRQRHSRSARRSRCRCCLALGDRDMAGPPHEVPASYPGSSDITLLVLPATGHAHFLFDSRHHLFDRAATWCEAIRSGVGRWRRSSPTRPTTPTGCSRSWAPALVLAAADEIASCAALGAKRRDGAHRLPGRAAADVARAAGFLRGRHRRSVADAASRLGVAGIDGARLLGERAALTGYHARGRCFRGRQLPAAAGPGWLAGSEPRARRATGSCCRRGSRAVSIASWGALAAALRTRAAAACVERGQAARACRLAAMRPRSRRAHGNGAAKSIVSWRDAARPPARFPWWWTCPRCGRARCARNLLQLMGAQVIKVESTARPDGMRRAGDGFYDLLNAGKASVALDLAQPAGLRAAAPCCCGRADIVVEASRPRALRQLGIHAEAILDENPGLTWISITGHGREGRAPTGSPSVTTAQSPVACRRCCGRPVGAPCSAPMRSPTRSPDCMLPWRHGWAISSAAADCCPCPWRMSSAMASQSAALGGDAATAARAPRQWAGRIREVDVAGPRARPSIAPARELGADTQQVFSRRCAPSLALDGQTDSKSSRRPAPARLSPARGTVSGISADLT